MRKKKLNVVSERVYLFAFSVILILLSFLFSTTILVSTVLTVVFLSLFLTIREEREWRSVKNAVFSMIGMQSSLLFGELLRFTENELDEPVFKLSLMYTQDVKIRKEMIFSKLSELRKREPFQLTPSYVSVFRSDKEMLNLFLDIKRELGDVQIKYGRHLTSKLTARLIKIQDLLELMNNSYEMDLRLNKLQGQLPLLRDLISKLISNQKQDQKLFSIDLIQNILPTCTKSLFQEIYELWKLGIEFDYA